ncbi:hypothetical protein ACIHAX_19515 [Nocardia sp. NPDC051929]|uniref:hypothetical protein n=1 Tax=unclassified Nocardia TaxID=2637762 RepID=UPI003431D9CB
MSRDVRGNWSLHQSNGFTVHVEVAGEDGDGTFNGKGNIHGQPGFIEFTDTRATDDEITFQMGDGRYVGRFDFQGRLTGTTFDLSHPHSHATWFADKLFGFL